MPETLSIAQANNDSKTIFGFWVYLMTDCLLFATLFATYLVLHNNTFGGPSGQEIFNLPYVLGETLLLLASSFTCGLGALAAQKNKKQQVIAWFGVTFFLGLSFVTMELLEFAALVREGNSWVRSGFLTSYFTLVSTHGAHISIGLLWMIVLMAQIWQRGLIPSTLRRLTCLRLFWHFLDIVWVFIFSIVYLMGAIA